MDSLVQIVSDEFVKKIDITNLTEKQIQRKKESLIRQHIKTITKKLESFFIERIEDFCNARIFFIQSGNLLYLCGAYSVNFLKKEINEKSYSLRTYDYLLYSQKTGFFLILGCSEPLNVKLFLECTSPAIYYKACSDTEYKHLQYRETYRASDFYDVQTIYNQRVKIADFEYDWSIKVFQENNVLLELDQITKFSELPKIPGYFKYSCEKVVGVQYGFRLIPSFLYNYNTNTITPLLSKIYLFGFDYQYDSLSPIVTELDNVNLRISDINNIYFYVGQTDTIAFKMLCKCVNQYGTFKQMPNLLEEDASVNYQVCFQRSTPNDVLSFVLGLIVKSKVLYPLIMGCPIHDVIEVLCKDCVKNPYALPEHRSDSISATNAIDYLMECYGFTSNWELVSLLTKAYGSYSVSDRNAKYWLYVQNEFIDCEYLPTSMETIIGEPINGSFVKKLDHLSYDYIWKSEKELFRLISIYYPNAKMHYRPKWLNKQHLDVFIPDQNIAIEYQGQQHYEVVPIFGGKEAFRTRQQLDAQKAEGCLQHGVTLIEWPYSVPVTIANLFAIFNNHGIKNIPNPTVF